MFLFLCSECSRHARLRTLLCVKLVGNGSAISLDFIIPRLSDFQRAAELIARYIQATNSKQQNPCEIAGALEAACQGYCASRSMLHLRF